MSVPSSINDLSTTASSNSPAGTDSIGVSLDDYLRAIQAIIKQNSSKGTDIASASLITVPNAGSYFVVTGTTTINGIVDSWNGRAVLLKFSGALTLTHSASLILFGSNITTAAGDVLHIANESSGVWRAASYTRAASGNVTLSGTETLTNKTIVAASNTITTAASGNLAATELDSALAELDSDKADRVIPAADVNIAVLDLSTGNLEDGGATVASLAPLESPTFTGTPTLPTGTIATTQSTGDNSTAIATTAYVDAVTPIFTESYTSGEEAITAGRGFTLAHSLSAQPSLIQFSLKCKTTDLNYSVNDEVVVNPGLNSDISTYSRGISCIPDTSNLTIRLGSASSCFVLLDKSTGTRGTITNANWKLIARAWV